MLRLPYRKSPLELVPPPLREETELDLAEAIFGFTKGEDEKNLWPNEEAFRKAKAYASRVFVSDATLASGQQSVWLNEGQPVIPKILGSPKPTTFQHYLVQQRPEPVPIGGQFADGRPRTRLELSDYDSTETALRGHKLYWHKGQVGIEQIQEPEPDKKSSTQLTEICLVREGVRFIFVFALRI